MKKAVDMTGAELKRAMQRTTVDLERAAVRDYDKGGPYYESPGTRRLMQRWNELTSEALSRDIHS